jgi:hypothetical protein
MNQSLPVSLRKYANTIRTATNASHASPNFISMSPSACKFSGETTCSMKLITIATLNFPKFQGRGPGAASGDAFLAGS